MKPNGVLFKLDDGTVVFVLIKDGVWDWDILIKPKEDYWKDLSAVNPFEWVFIFYDEINSTITTFNNKTTIENASFLKLHDSNTLKGFIEMDYKFLHEELTKKILNNEAGWKVIGDIKL